MKHLSVYLLIIPTIVIFSWKNKTFEKQFENYTELDTTKIVSRIALGSCNGQDSEQPLWGSILQNKPDLWIWLGDIVYGDTEDPEFLKEKYTKQKNNPEYQKLLNTTPVIGVWDDHDYGKNDGGKEYSMKKISQQLLLDFLDVPDNAPQRIREGAYSSYVFGKDNQKIKIILLDVRYFRDSLPKNDARLCNRTGDMLGEEQWEWLESELNRTDIQLFIIGNGTQILPTKYPFEKWANFPKSRQRLFDLFKEHQDKRFLLLSGDLHMGEIAKIKPKGFDSPVYEMTASGLTHFYEKKPRNKYRIGRPANQLNFGLIEIVWNENPVKVKLQLRGLNNKLVTEEIVYLK